jgi:protein-S-isoprenylcysteine O-methyltransferase Ste14
MKLAKEYYFDLIAVILVIFYNYLTKEWDNFHFTGLVLIIFSLPFWLLAREQLGKSFTVRPQAVKLVTSGLYSKFRNPIYLFSSITLFGAILPSRNILQYFLFILLIMLQLYRVKKEEAVLEKKFGKKYIKYRSKTWFL